MIIDYDDVCNSTLIILRHYMYLATTKTKISTVLTSICTKHINRMLDYITF